MSKSLYGRKADNGGWEKRGRWSGNASTGDGGTTPVGDASVPNNQTSMTREEAFTFAIPRDFHSAVLPTNHFWRRRVDTAPDTDLDPNTVNLRNTWNTYAQVYNGPVINVEKYNLGFMDLRGRGLTRKPIIYNRGDQPFIPDDFYQDNLGAHAKYAPYDFRAQPAPASDHSLGLLYDGVSGGVGYTEIWQAYVRPREQYYVDGNDNVTTTRLPIDLYPTGSYPGITVPTDGYYSGMEVGRFPNLLTHTDISGQFPPGGSAAPKGSSAVGIANAFGCVTLWEARQIIEGYTHPTDPGQNVVATSPYGPVRADTGLRANGDPVINHALNCAMGDNKSGEISWPAGRGDGNSTAANQVLQGQRGRLDPSLTSEQLAAATSRYNGSGITALGKGIAEALKRYGFIITDKTGNNSNIFTGESGRFMRVATGTDPWGSFQQSGAAGGWTGGKMGYCIEAIPLHTHLQWLKKDWGKPA